MPDKEWAPDDADAVFVGTACGDAAKWAWAETRALAQSNVAVVVPVEAGAARTFYKRACVADLQRKSPRNPDAKWRVTLRSFVNEHKFLASRDAARALGEAGLRVPRVVALDPDPAASPPGFSTVFRTLTECLDIGGAVVERRFLDEPEALALAAWLARFHSCFFQSPRFASEWDLGGWWRKPLRPTVRFGTVAECLARLAAEFPDAFARAGIPASADLADVAAFVQCAAERDAFVRLLPPPNTVMHGDVKTCNAFFGVPGASGAAVSASDVVAIDFQWTGPSYSGVADVVYLVFGGVRLARGGGDGADDEFFARAARVVRAVQARYRASAAPGLFTEQCPFERAWDAELLDYFSTALPYLLADLTPKLALRNKAKYGYLTFEEDAPTLAFFCASAVDAARRVRGDVEATMT